MIITDINAGEEHFVFVWAGGLVMGKDREFRFGHCEFEWLMRHSGTCAKWEVGLMGLTIRAEG